MIKRQNRPSITPDYDDFVHTLKHKGFKPEWEDSDLMLKRSGTLGRSSTRHEVPGTRDMPYGSSKITAIPEDSFSRRQDLIEKAEPSDVAEHYGFLEPPGTSERSRKSPRVSWLPKTGNAPDAARYCTTSRTLSQPHGSKASHDLETEQQLRKVSAIEGGRPAELERLQTDLNRAWHKLQPWLDDIPTVPVLKELSLPPNFAQKVSQPLSRVEDLLTDAERKPGSAPQCLDEAVLITNEVLKYLRSDSECDDLRRALKEGGKPEVLEQLLKTGPDFLDGLAICFQVLKVAGFCTDQPESGRIETRVLKRCVDAISALNELPASVDAVLDVAGVIGDFSTQYRAAKAREDDDLRAFSTATGRVFAHRGLAAGLAALSVPVTAIPVIGQIAGPLLLLSSNALARILTAPLPD